MSYETYKVRVYNDGGKEWYLNGKRHRTDGPAVECSNGYKAWWLNDKCHRTDGPAIESSNGSKEWYLDGKLHRTDGPAIEFSNGYKEWWLDDKELTEEEHRRQTRPAPCNNKSVEVDGVRYRLVAE